MGLFGFGKKRQEELPLPPPPSPPDLQPLLRGDIDQIRAPESEMPELSSFEEHTEELPELPLALPAPTRMLEPQRAPFEGEEEVVYDKTVQQPAEEEIPIREVVRAIPKPAFVAVEDYKRIINDTNTIRSKLMDAENFVRRLGDLKNEEERSFERWRTMLEDVEKKLNYVDHLIAKAG